MDGERLKYWLALRRIIGREKVVAPPELKALLDAVEDARDLFEGRCYGPGERGGMDRSFEVIAEKAMDFSEWDRIEKELELVEGHGVRLVTFKDGDYPERLREIYDPPLVLYAKGGFYDGDSPVAAVVGTRRATHYGLSMAEAIGRGLAEAGVVVVSGLARGCDTAAHRGALKAAGRKTVAVLGTGIDVVYPKENRRLYDEIAERGLILSEFPMSTPPLAMNFPVRNRIISGLSMGVVVVEAPLRSGAVMTARLALEEGREVFALPGRAGAKTSGGTNRLIKNGAVLVEGVDDILDVLCPGRNLHTTGDDRSCGTAKERPSGVEGLVIGLLDEGPLHIDDITEKSGLSVREVSALLLSMELKGLVEQRPGKLFTRKH